MQMWISGKQKTKKKTRRTYYSLLFQKGLGGFYSVPVNHSQMIVVLCVRIWGTGDIISNWM